MVIRFFIRISWSLAVLATLLCFLGTTTHGQQPTNNLDSLELRDLDLSRWAGKDLPGGTAKSPLGINRNSQKNRQWKVVHSDSVRHWSFDEFIRRTNDYTLTLGLDNFTFTTSNVQSLTPERLEQLAVYERQIVSVTGWLVLTYPGGAESCNSNSAWFHDWHLEIFPANSDHYPVSGDSTPIIAEVTPHAEANLYHAGVRLRRLAAFIRKGEPPTIRYAPTGSKAHKVRITGYLFWDYSHAQHREDVGDTIHRSAQGYYHHPWRISPWEIHPILKIEDLGTE